MKDKSYITSSAKLQWCIRGIEPETRTAANKAARRAGVTVGEWVNRAIWEAAQVELKGGHPVPAQPLDATLKQLAEGLQAQAEAMQRQSEEARAEREAMAARLAGIEDRQHQAQKKPVEGRLSRAWGILRGKP